MNESTKPTEPVRYWGTPDRSLGDCLAAVTANRCAKTGDYGVAVIAPMSIGGGRRVAKVGAYGYALVAWNGDADAHAVAGPYGVAEAQRCGIVQAGERGELRIRYYANERWRTATAYVGEDGILPDVPYRLEVTYTTPVSVRFVRAD